MDVENENRNENIPKHNVHKVLAHSYSVYFVLFLIGVGLDLVFRFKIFTHPTAMPIGFFIIAFATILILWAQRTSHDLRGVQEVKTEHFCRGPYCYTRTPTHWGLFFLVLGFGIITNALFVIISTIVSFLISKFVFLDKQERILAEKYGAPYLEYKKLVKF